MIVTTSWDDCHRLDTRVLDLLTEHGLKGTFYAPRHHPEVGRIDESLLLTLHKGGGEIGAHTVSHPDLRKVSAARVLEEAQGSKDWLESLLGESVRSFCYPSGFHDRNVVEQVKKAGYLGARTTRYDRLSLPADPFLAGISVQAADASPLLVLRTWRHIGGSPRVLYDWEVRAKRSFDRARAQGGVWHLWGHSWEIDRAGDWGRLERVLRYVGGHANVTYATNGELFARAGSG